MQKGGHKTRSVKREKTLNKSSTYFTNLVGKKKRVGGKKKSTKEGYERKEVKKSSHFR